MEVVFITIEGHGGKSAALIGYTRTTDLRSPRHCQRGSSHWLVLGILKWGKSRDATSALTHQRPRELKGTESPMLRSPGSLSL
jgi:hypothetical protein